MGRPENETLSALDDANAAQQLIRSEARRLVDELRLSRAVGKRLETIIRATIRTQAYLALLREIEHSSK
jgi:hypothetical protein